MGGGLVPCVFLRVSTQRNGGGMIPKIEIIIRGPKGVGKTELQKRIAHTLWCAGHKVECFDIYEGQKQPKEISATDQFWLKRHIVITTKAS